MNPSSKKDTKDKFYTLAMIFANIHDQKEMSLLRNAFNTLFDLIDEAEKGSYYELLDDTFIPVLSKGYDPLLLKKLKFKEEDIFIGFRHDEGMHLDSYIHKFDKRDDSKFDFETLEIFKALGTYEKFVSLHGAVKIEDRIVGLVCIENFSTMVFSEESRKLLQVFLQHLSNFYTMKYLHERNKKKYTDTIAALVRAIEVKDHYTYGHGERVQKFSVLLGQKYGLSNQDLKILEDASILHDVGKIGIPTEIINKNGPLTDLEYEIVKTHPESSKKILDEIQGYEAISDLAYAHHEHFNGGGYPRGLKGDDIPISAQIIQLADAFDAMTSDRPYRKAFSTEKALQIIQEERAKQFHPDLVDLFLNLEGFLDKSSL
jgi:polar amino acid transport system substrate-binding protein